MKPRWIIVLLATLVCMAAPAMAQQTAPFLISGHIFDSDSNPCNEAWVQITNLDTGEIWGAENDPTLNYYQLVLDSGDVSVDDILRFDVSGESGSKTVEHAITQTDINGGGLFDFNITTFASVVIPANLHISPPRLDLGGGKQFTVVVKELSSGYSLEDVVMDTIVCEGATAISGKMAGSALRIKFSVQDMVGVPVGNAVELTVTGELTDGTLFEGSDTVKTVE
ncbi:MAG TPA: hypothetical protein C5S50_10875 [Methanosarcinaceae archaeon]|nr:hypothetical protein [Methanosarcinaceae archaeon]